MMIARGCRFGGGSGSVRDAEVSLTRRDRSKGARAGQRASGRLVPHGSHGSYAAPFIFAWPVIAIFGPPKSGLRSHLA